MKWFYFNRLEKSAMHKGFFSSNLQFGFEEGVGCIEASFTILETINHMLERGTKVFGCFLDVRKAFGTVWIYGLLYKLFKELGIEGKMWLTIKDLYTDVKARVLFLAFYQESLIFPKGRNRDEFWLLLCAKFTKIVY